MAINRTKVLDAAQKYRRKGQLDRAIREYVSLMEDDPSDMRTLLIIADLYVKTENLPAALESYKQVAYHYLRDDIYDKAVAVFKQAIGLAPQDAVLRRDLGEAYHRMGRLKEAVGEYHHAQRLYEERSDLVSQRDILERMVRLEPEEPALRIKLAEHYVKLKLHDEAVELFSFAAKQFEDDGRIDDYLKVVERIVFVRPKDLSLRKRIATQYLDGNEFNRALKHLKVCFEGNPNDIDTLRMMSTAFEQLQDIPKAVLVYGQLAKLYRDSGDTPRSNQIYEQILRLDPNHQDARKMLAYEARQRGQAAPQPATRQQRPEDSAPSGAMLNTGNLRQPAAYQSYQQQPKAPEALPEIEFLDDDLGDILAPATAAATPMPPARPPAPQPPLPRTTTTAKPLPPKPQQPVAPQPKPPAKSSGLGDDLLSFAADAIDELGDGLALHGLQAYPDAPAAVSEPPIIELEPLAIEPLEIDAIELEPEPAPPEDDLDIQQAIDEAKVFLKYGLKDRSIQTLLDITARYPQALTAREELAAIYLRYNDRVLATDQYMEAARTLRATPERAAYYLSLAAQTLGNRAQVEAMAAQMGLSLDAPAAIPQDALMELELLDTNAELDALDEMQAMLSPPQQPARREVQTAAVMRVAPRAAAESIIEISDGDLDMLTDGELLEEELDEGLDTGQIDAQALATQDVPSLDLDTDDVIMDASLIEEDASFEDAELIDIDDLPSDIVRPSGLSVAPPTSLANASSFSLSEDEADAMFNDLFGDSSQNPMTMSFSGSQDLAGLAEVDFLIEQGLMSEAEDALSRIAQDNPQSNTLERRRLSLQHMRADGGPVDNPFSGARSLSKQFAYNSVDEMASHQRSLASADSVPSLIGAGDHAVNTNFELGAAYLEMGLLNEAIEEFSQSLYDPDVADSAAYNIAMCEVKLGLNDQAKQRLTQLLQDSSTTAHVRASASQLLQRL